MVHSARFWDKIAEKYFRDPIADEDAYKIKLQITQEHLHPEMQLLEIGCGTGGTALQHAPHVAQVRAIDISSAMVTIARRQAEEKGVKNVTFEQADVATFEAEPASFGAILAMSLLHLVEDRTAVIEKIRKLLKPGGVFVSNTAALGYRMGYLRFVLPLMRLVGKAPYVEIFKAKQLEKEIEQAGFRIVHHWQPEKSPSVFLVAERIDQ